MLLVSTRLTCMLLCTCLANLHATTLSDLATRKQGEKSPSESIGGQDPQGRRLFPSAVADDGFPLSNRPRNDNFLADEVQYAGESSREILSVTTGDSRHKEELDPYSLVPEDFHQFLDIPIHKYKNGTEIRTHQRHRTPLVSGGYANTQVQGFGNNKRVPSQRKKVTHRPVSYGYQLATASPHNLDYGQRKRQDAWLNKSQSVTRTTTSIPTFTTTESTSTTTTTVTTTTPEPTTTTTSQPTTTTASFLPIQESHVDQLNIQWQRQQDWIKAREESNEVIVTEPASVVTAAKQTGFGRKKSTAYTTEPSVTIRPQTTKFTTENIPEAPSQWPFNTELSNTGFKNRNRPTLYETLALGKRPNNRRRPFLPSDRVRGNQRKRPLVSSNTPNRQNNPPRPSLLPRFPPAAPTTKQSTIRTTEIPQSFPKEPQLNEIVSRPPTENRKKPSLSAFLSGTVERQTTTEKFGLREQFPTFENQFQNSNSQRQVVKPALESWQEKRQKFSNPLQENVEREYAEEPNKVVPQNQYDVDKGQFNFNPDEAESFHLNEQFNPEKHQFGEFTNPKPDLGQKVPLFEKTKPSINFVDNVEIDEEINFELPSNNVEEIRKETNEALANHPLNLRPPIPGRITEQRPVLRRPQQPPTQAPSYLNSFLSWFRSDTRPPRPLPYPVNQRPQNAPTRLGPGRPWQSFNRPPPQFQRQVPGNIVSDNLKPPAGLEQGQLEYIPQISAKVGTLSDAREGTEITRENKPHLPNILPRFRPNINDQRVRSPHQQSNVQRRRGHPGQVNTSQMKHGALSLPSVPQLMRVQNNKRPNTFIAAPHRPIQHRPHVTTGQDRITPDQMSVRRAERPALSKFTPMNVPPPRPSHSQPPPPPNSYNRQEINNGAPVFDDLIASESHQEVSGPVVSKQSPHHMQHHQEGTDSSSMGTSSFHQQTIPTSNQENIRMQENKAQPLINREEEEIMKSSENLQTSSQKQNAVPHSTVLSVPSGDNSLLVNVGASSSYRIAPVDDPKLETANRNVLILGSVESEPVVHDHGHQGPKSATMTDRQKRATPQELTVALHRQDQLEFIPVSESMRRANK